MPILEFRLKLLGKQAINQSSSVSVYTLIPKASGLFIYSRGKGEQQWLDPCNSFFSFFPQRARRAVLPQEEEGSGAGQLVTDFGKKEGDDHPLFLIPFCHTPERKRPQLAHPSCPHHREVFLIFLLESRTEPRKGKSSTLPWASGYGGRERSVRHGP